MTIPMLTPGEWFHLSTALDARLAELLNGDLGHDEGDDELAAEYEALLEKIGPEGTHMWTPEAQGGQA